MKLTLNQAIAQVRDYVILTLGLLSYVLGLVMFILPNNLVGGGVTGISSIIQYATGGAINAGVSYFVINVGLLAAAFFILGKGFGGKTIYAIVFSSFMISWLQNVFYNSDAIMSIIQTLAIDNGKLMSSICGAIMAGLGVGLTMSVGGSTGGTDIIALIVNKYRDVSPGKVILLLDVVIIGSSIIVPSYTASGELLPWYDKVTTIVYGFILITVNSYVIDLFLSGSKQSVQLTIFSKKYETLADAIMTDMNRGVTILEGKGWYSKQSQPVIIVLARKTDLKALLHCVRQIDPDAFLSITSTTGVYGKGFDLLRK